VPRLSSSRTSQRFGRFCVGFVGFRLLAAACLVGWTACAPAPDPLTQNAERGNAEAQYSLGWRYASQQAPPDYAAARKWYARAADNGFAAAQNSLGVMYAKGQAVEMDYVAAAKWYRQAAEQGYVQAQYNLGVVYAAGKGVPQDFSEAALWYRRAAEQGYVQAQYNLGVVCARGEGLKQDAVEAHKWLNLAASNVNGARAEKYGAARDSVGALLNPEELAQAQSLARDWLPVAAVGASEEPESAE